MEQVLAFQATAPLANYVAAYTSTIQHPGDRSMTRYKHDLNKMVENNEISTGPGRWALGVPNAYGNAVFAPDPTVRQQKWGASHDMSSTKTDVESDLRNLGRPTTRSACGQWDPTAPGAQRQLTAMPEADFPMTHGRLVDPPCTLRGSGWNRWEWLCQNPQENAMIPFEWGVDSRHAVKDSIYSTIQAGPAVAAEAAYCGRIYLDPAVPVPRLGGVKGVPNFTNTLAGASIGMGAVHETPRGAAVQGVGKYGAGPLAAPPRGPDPNPAETARAATGVLAPPPPFTNFIAPH
jgi:hypothetical protein